MLWQEVYGMKSVMYVCDITSDYMQEVAKTFPVAWQEESPIEPEVGGFTIVPLSPHFKICVTNCNGLEKTAVWVIAEHIRAVYNDIRKPTIMLAPDFLEDSEDMRDEFIDYIIN